MRWAVLIPVLLPAVFIPAIVDVAVLKSEVTGEFPDQMSVNVLAIGRAVGLAFVLVVISALRWWPVVLREQLRVRAWVWTIPAALLVTALALTDYTRLASAGLALSLPLLLGTLLVGAGEELMFRGVVLTFLRERYREVTVAVATSLVFGLRHITAGLLNALASTVFGYLMYYTRRVSGGIWVPIVVHALYDFSVFSGFATASPNQSGNASPALFLLSLALVVVVIVGHRRAEPRTGRATPSHRLP